MAIKTQGTELYVIDPADDSVIDVSEVTSVDGIDSSIAQIQTTTLADSAHTYVAGLADPGNASFGINIDPSNTDHVRLHALKKAGTSLKWALGWSDGTAAPTVDSNGDFVLPSTRSWLTFDGHMSSYPFSFALNTIAQSTVGIQISGDPVLTAKS